jgi:hypothetical protein
VLGQVQENVSNFSPPTSVDRTRDRILTTLEQSMEASTDIYLRTQWLNHNGETKHPIETECTIHRPDLTDKTTNLAPT